MTSEPGERPEQPEESERPERWGDPPWTPGDPPGRRPERAAVAVAGIAQKTLAGALVIAAVAGFGGNALERRFQAAYLAAFAVPLVLGLVAAGMLYTTAAGVRAGERAARVLATVAAAPTLLLVLFAHVSTVSAAATDAIERLTAEPAGALIGSNRSVAIGRSAREPVGLADALAPLLDAIAAAAHQLATVAAAVLLVLLHLPGSSRFFRSAGTPP